MGDATTDAELVVVGAGLVGAAAAKYAALRQPEARVLVVGPSEPSERATGVYGCHADEGRICRKLDVDPVWAELAARAMGRYAEIEAASGVRFHAAAGCVAVGRKDGPFLRAVAATAHSQGLQLEELDEPAMRAHWPDLRLDATLFGDEDDDDDDDDDLRNAGSTTTPKARVVEYAGLYERGAAGHVSPRKLLRAQLTLCARHGVRHLDAVARRVTRRDDGAYDVAVSDNASAPDDDPHQTLRARRVLVATNAWTNFHALLPRRVKLELTTQTAIRRAVRGVPDDDRDDATSPWPCVIVKAGATPFGARAQPKLDACYFLPPTRYADGRAYAKIGHGTFFERPLFGPIEAREWYQLDDDATGDDPGHNLERRNGHPPRETRDDAFARCRLAALLARIVRTPDAAFDGPNVPIRCVIPKTATKRPYLFKADDRLGACVGCNGYAAKSSDELGRLAAHMIMSDDGDDVSWGPTIPPDAFRPVFEDDDEETLAAAAIA